MNIFVSDACPYKSAKNLDNRRVLKMILESSQLLSTAMNLNGLNGPYKTTHQNHPCAIWTRATRGNYKWVVRHLSGLLAEYTLRYGKTHKCESHLGKFFECIQMMPDGDLQPFVNCTIYKDVPDTIQAYKDYLCYKWTNDKFIPKRGTDNIFPKEFFQ